MKWLQDKYIYLTIHKHLTTLLCMLEAQLLRGERWDPINRFNPVINLCLSQARTLISNAICHGLFFMFNEFRWEVIVCYVDINGMVDNCCKDSKTNHKKNRKNCKNIQAMFSPYVLTSWILMHLNLGGLLLISQFKYDMYTWHDTI